MVTRACRCSCCGCNTYPPIWSNGTRKVIPVIILFIWEALSNWKIHRTYPFRMNTCLERCPQTKNGESGTLHFQFNFSLPVIKYALELNRTLGKASLPTKSLPETEKLFWSTPARWLKIIHHNHFRSNLTTMVWNKVRPPKQCRKPVISGSEIRDHIVVFT